ncbi:unnamed protein product [Symbiodinium natans]|uniref:Uncharacterized protein n=1 Tax=Symbiodinium natans TaxID=878477 RepID=A0A812SSG7_9DINO|nr:unnamed protein product [Symbiodinium natans]
MVQCSGSPLLLPNGRRRGRNQSFAQKQAAVTDWKVKIGASQASPASEPSVHLAQQKDTGKRGNVGVKLFLNKNDLVDWLVNKVAPLQSDAPMSIGLKECNPVTLLPSVGTSLDSKPLDLPHERSGGKFLCLNKEPTTFQLKIRKDAASLKSSKAPAKLLPTPAILGVESGFWGVD